MATKTENKRLFKAAMEKGMAAGAEKVPQPMLVGSPTTPLGSDIDPSKPVYFVPQGVCGFAWVTIHPGNCSFAQWVKKNGKGSNAYGGGVSVRCHAFGQSLEQKEAWAQAFAQVLQDAGIKAYAESRMD